MINRCKTLYRRLFPCLLLSFLVACSTLPPYQQISDAKQALAAAEKVLHQTTAETEASLSEEDRASYNLAKDSLNQAEKALSQQQFAEANAWSARSKQQSQLILKRHQQSQSNIHFRY